MKKAVITGGTRLIGSHLAEALLAKGYEVHVTMSQKKNDATQTVEGTTLHQSDIRDTERMKEICKGAELIFHLAAKTDQYCIDFPVESSDVNVTGTVGLLQVARELGVKKVVFASSATVYGAQESVPYHEDLPAEPVDPYGLYKYYGECAMRLWSRSYGVPTVSLRLFNAYGPRDLIGPDGFVIGRFLDLRRKGQPLTIDGDGKSTRDYVHVKDIVNAFIIAAERDDVRGGEIFNIGSGVETSLNDLAAAVGGEVIHLDSRTGFRAGPTRRVADISKAKDRLGWSPSIDFLTGISSLKQELGIA